MSQPWRILELSTARFLFHLFHCPLSKLASSWYRSTSAGPEQAYLLLAFLPLFSLIAHRGQRLFDASLEALSGHR